MKKTHIKSQRELPVQMKVINEGVLDFLLPRQAVGLRAPQTIIRCPLPVLILPRNWLIFPASVLRFMTIPDMRKKSGVTVFVFLEKQSTHYVAIISARNTGTSTIFRAPFSTTSGFFSNQRESISWCPKSQFPSKNSKSTNCPNFSFKAGPPPTPPPLEAICCTL